MRIGVTGHRPKSIYPRMTYAEFDADVYPMMIDFAASVLAPVQGQVEHVYTGMATGWDQAVATACIHLGIPYRACVPFLGQESFWPAEVIERYNFLLKSAQKKYLISKGPYTAFKMQVRNEFMVDHADIVLALFNGERGGTANCVNYAKRRSKQVDNRWSSWLEYRADSLLEDL